MKRGTYEGFVGVFDSGVGGVSVLRELVRALPHEDFVFFGDSAHNPYGEKTPDEVVTLSRAIVGDLLAAGCKAIVVACNTATSAAAARLREEHPNVPILGVEPALKPAVLACRGGRVLVMATPMTVSLDKFQRLLHTWRNTAHIVAVPCGGLASRIERGHLDEPDLTELIERLVGEYAGSVDAVVLGCTHYPFVREQIAQVLGDVRFFDSAEGTARQLWRRLYDCALASTSERQGRVVFLSSMEGPEEPELYRRFFEGRI